MEKLSNKAIKYIGKTFVVLFMQYCFNENVSLLEYASIKTKPDNMKKNVTICGPDVNNLGAVSRNLLPCLL